MENTKTRDKRKVVIAIVALLLAIAVAITVSAAYYITKGSPTDTQARVAKWGVTITANDNEAFGSEYDSAGNIVSSTTGTTTISDTSSTEVVVKSENQVKVVAPGTRGTLFACKVEGKPEVAFKVSFETESTNTTQASGDSSKNYPIQLLGTWDISKSAKTDGSSIGSRSDTTTASQTSGSSDTYFYCPIIFTFCYGNTTETVYGASFESKDTLESELNGKLAKVVAYYKPGTDLSSMSIASSNATTVSSSSDTVTFPAIYWEWAFEGSSSATAGADTSASGNTKQNNDADTALGNLAATWFSSGYSGTTSGSSQYASSAGESAGIPTIKTNLTCVIQQVQSSSSATSKN
jgi:hypothetical protein